MAGQEPLPSSSSLLHWYLSARTLACCLNTVKPPTGLACCLTLACCLNTVKPQSHFLLAASKQTSLHQASHDLQGLTPNVIV